MTIYIVAKILSCTYVQIKVKRIFILHLHLHSCNPLDRSSIGAHGVHRFLNCPIWIVWNCNYARLSFKTTRTFGRDFRSFVLRVCCISHLGELKGDAAKI